MNGARLIGLHFTDQVECFEHMSDVIAPIAPVLVVQNWGDELYWPWNSLVWFPRHIRPFQHTLFTVVRFDSGVIRERPLFAIICTFVHAVNVIVYARSREAGSVEMSHEILGETLKVSKFLLFLCAVLQEDLYLEADSKSKVHCCAMMGA